jgi:metal-responsive CopG/Arc/MetJ family transcriptional regulator
MHMHVHHLEHMRTTVELKDEHRSALLELAGRRGLKGFSDLVGEAIEVYLQSQARMNESLKRALRAQGSLNAQEADDLCSGVAEVRANWRGGMATLAPSADEPEASK